MDVVELMLDGGVEAEGDAREKSLRYGFHHCHNLWHLKFPRMSYKMPAFSASFDIILFAVVPVHDHVLNR